jgi:L-threonylcarbamoyladenylate synthase
MTNIIKVDLVAPDESLLQQAADVVKRGGVIVYPTDTLYGLGADVTNENAVNRIYEIKKREAKPILMIVDSVEMMSPFVQSISLAARIMMERLWPGPLTLVFKASDRVPRMLNQGNGMIGVRIPSCRVCLRLLSHTRFPLTSTSANISGQPVAGTMEQMRTELPDVDLFLDGGVLPESEPSTVVDVSGAVPRILRVGATPVEKLHAIVPKILE